MAASHTANSPKVRWTEKDNWLNPLCRTCTEEQLRQEKEDDEKKLKLKKMLEDQKKLIKQFKNGDVKQGNAGGGNIRTLQKATKASKSIKTNLKKKVNNGGMFSDYRKKLNEYTTRRCCKKNKDGSITNEPTTDPGTTSASDTQYEPISYDATYNNTDAKIYTEDGSKEEDVKMYLNQVAPSYNKLKRDNEGYVDWKDYDLTNRGKPKIQDIYSPYKKYYHQLDNNIEIPELTKMNYALFGPTPGNRTNYKSYTGLPSQPYQIYGGNSLKIKKLFDATKAAKPTKATKAAKPTKAAKATKPTKAAKPTKPAKPTKGAKTAKPTKGAKAAKTIKGVKPKKPKTIKVRKPTKTLKIKKSPLRKL